MTFVMNKLGPADKKQNHFSHPCKVGLGIRFYVIRCTLAIAQKTYNVLRKTSNKIHHSHSPTRPSVTLPHCCYRYYIRARDSNGYRPFV